MAISNKMSILGTKKAVMAYNGGYYLPSVSDEGILSWSPTVEGMAPIPEVNVRGPQGPQGSDASVTAEAVQAVVPIAWNEYTTAPRIAIENSTGNIVIGDGAVADVFAGVTVSDNSVTIGANAKGGHLGVGIGANSSSNIASTVVGATASARKRDATVFGYMSHADQHGVAVGNMTYANGTATTSLGAMARQANTNCIGAISVGFSNMAYNANAIVIGSRFDETVDGQKVTHECTTHGTGSITIGAGANTLNNGDTESSNSVTIGCKANNIGADSVVIGAGAQSQKSSPGNGSTAVGAISIGAASNCAANSVAIGRFSNAKEGGGVAIGVYAGSDFHSISIGYAARAHERSVALGSICYVDTENSVALGYNSNVTAQYATAIGTNAKAADQGVTVFRSTASDGIYTQLYFSGANTPLANQYYNGEAMMGYVVTDSAGTKLACGTRRLSELFTDNTLTQPASLDENGEWVMPKVFHPSDLDLLTEEPSEPKEYQPLPVYPIVEPEIPEVEEV